MWMYQENQNEISNTPPESKPLSKPSKRRKNDPVKLKCSDDSRCRHRTAKDILIRLALIYLCGLLLGSAVWILLPETGIKQYLSCFVQRYLMMFGEAQYKLFCLLFIACAAQLTMIFVSGFSAAGCFIIPYLCLLKGIGTGCVQSAVLMRSESIKETLEIVLTFFPASIIEMIPFLCLSKIAFDLSLKLYRYCSKEMFVPIRHSSGKLIRLYFVSYLILSVPCGMVVGMIGIFDDLL